MKPHQYIIISIALFLQVSCSESESKAKAEESLNAKDAEPSSSHNDSHNDSQQSDYYELEGIRIKLPKPPISKIIDLPRETKALVSVFNSHEVKLGTTSVTIIHVVSKSDFNIDGAIQGSISQVKATPAATNFSSSTESFLVNDLPGRKAKISLDSKGHSIEQYIWICARGNEWWQVQVLGSKENEQEIEKLSKEVFSSIEVLAQ